MQPDDEIRFRSLIKSSSAPMAFRMLSQRAIILSMLFLFIHPVQAEDCEGVPVLVVKEQKATPAQLSNWSQLMEAGVKSADLHDYIGCKRNFNSALEEAIRIGNSDGCVEKSIDNLAWVNVQLHNYSEAEGLYKKLIGMNSSKDGELQLANLYRLEERYVEAEPLYRNSINSNAASSMSLKDYSQVLCRLGKTTEAKLIDAEVNWLEQSRGGVLKSRKDYIPRDNFGLNFSTYIKTVTEQINRVFHYRDSANRRTRISFSLESDGRVSRLRIESSSGNPLHDQAALNAVNDAGPFPNLPADAPRDVDITLSLPENLVTVFRKRN